VCGCCVDNDGHNNLARVVFASSPVLRIGSTLKEPPSISPTLSSPSTGPSGFFCVLPVMRSVFSGIESFGVYSPSTEDISSGGTLSLPTLGISLAIVEVVFVMCGFKGFSFCSFRCSSTFS
jgi:hypothetical protein